MQIRPWLRNALFLGVLSLYVDCALAQSGGGIPGYPQGPYPYDYATVQATVPVASEPGNHPGQFTFTRYGPTNADLTITFRISGSASNGVDYAAITNRITFAAGTLTNSLLITPVDEPAAIGVKTVTLTPIPPIYSGFGPLPPTPGPATVYIEYHYTNVPPSVKLVRPLSGQTFLAPANIELAATATDTDGSVATVEFFAGGTSLGVVTNHPTMQPSSTSTFILIWTNVSATNYVLTALAMDDQGATATSSPVSIVVQTPTPPPTNHPPAVRMISPLNRSMFFAPIDLPLYAFARDYDGTVTSVQFFVGTNSLGFSGPPPVVLPPPFPSPLGGGYPSAPIPIFSTNLYYLRWSNAPPGQFALTAQATDNVGATSTSAPVNIVIMPPPPPPPTNAIPVVSIVALDPLAIEGTNCYSWFGTTNVTPNWTNWPIAATVRFTNCGPQNAVFSVRRGFDTNGDLTVNYTMGGTATNGIDYLTLPGTVTIPAGQRAALITIVPIDDGQPEPNKTVVLSLADSTNSPADYLIGRPNRAGAIIIENGLFRPLTGLLPDRSFHIGMSGPDGAWFHIDCSTNMVNWNAICTNQVFSGMLDFVDSDAPQDIQRFYRIVPESNPPAQ